MCSLASQITSLKIVYSTVYSDADQRKHQSSASLAFVRGIHRGPVNSPHKGPVTRKMFPFDDVIMSGYFTNTVTEVLVTVKKETLTLKIFNIFGDVYTRNGTISLCQRNASVHVVMSHNHSTQVLCGYDTILDLSSEMYLGVFLWNAFSIHDDVIKWKHSPRYWPLVRCHLSPVNSPYKGPVTRKMFPFDDFIMWSR